jgi:hypothetical protein
VTIEVAEGEVHLDGAAWLSLIDGTAPAPQRDAVAGVPGMDIALEAGAEPAAVLQLDLITPGGAFTHEAWVAPEGMALLVDLGGGRRRLMALPPDHLAAGLARLVGLGPRRTPARVARDVGEDELEAWFGQDDAERAAAFEPIGADRAWTLGAAAAGAEPDDALLMAVADGAGGPWLVERSGEAMRLVPVSPTWVWRRLAGLLPALG